jgi:hypothetical protein
MPRIKAVFFYSEYLGESAYRYLSGDGDPYHDLTAERRAYYVNAHYDEGVRPRHGDQGDGLVDVRGNVLLVKASRANSKRRCWSDCVPLFKTSIMWLSPCFLILVGVACQDATRLGVVNRCSSAIEVRGSDARSFDGMRWHHIGVGESAKVVDASSRATLYIAVRAGGDVGDGVTTALAGGDLTGSSRKKVGYDVETTVAEDRCPK